ncbi:hypothetical protein XA68_13010 [Ophiocordyceps unilateralis]|uniref:Uncharacterized protein n=1 Tax=Ophiocordyceps unilateralis TaxID=268505 RepID=A0A2A9PCL2_OPHUN|nr:hypothetical protein XA68_13010 [Ophiocordyceps unilateralis]
MLYLPVTGYLGNSLQSISLVFPLSITLETFYLQNIQSIFVLSLQKVSDPIFFTRLSFLHYRSHSRTRHSSSNYVPPDLPHVYLRVQEARGVEAVCGSSGHKREVQSGI